MIPLFWTKHGAFFRDDIFQLTIGLSLEFAHVFVACLSIVDFFEVSVKILISCLELGCLDASLLLVTNGLHRGHLRRGHGLDLRRYFAADTIVAVSFTVLALRAILFS